MQQKQISNKVTEILTYCKCITSIDFESHIHKRKDSLVKVPLSKKTYTLSPISSHFLSISSSRTNLLPRDKSIICSPLQSAAHHLPFSSPPGGPSVPSAAAAPISRVLLVQFQYNRACFQHSHNAIFHWYFQKYSVRIL